MESQTIPQVLSADSINGQGVCNRDGEDLGEIEEIMLDLSSGRVAYAVLSFGGFLGMGDKLFAIPWEALTPDPVKDGFILNVDKETLENAPGFDKDDWPSFTDPTWGTRVYSHYGLSPYWV